MCSVVFGLLLLFLIEVPCLPLPKNNKISRYKNCPFINIPCHQNCGFSEKTFAPAPHYLANPTPAHQEIKI